MAQAEDRCHRLGQLNSVRVQYYVFRDTIDEWIAQTLIKKQNNIEQILPLEEYTNEIGSRKQELPSSTSSYTFDFGKYKGLRLEDTPEDFIQFLIKKEIWQKRPKLWHALHWKGLLIKNPPPTLCQPILESSTNLNTTNTVQTKKIREQVIMWYLFNQLMRVPMSITCRRYHINLTLVCMLVEIGKTSH